MLIPHSLSKENTSPVVKTWNIKIIQVVFQAFIKCLQKNEVTFEDIVEDDLNLYLRAGQTEHGNRWKCKQYKSNIYGDNSGKAMVDVRNYSISRRSQFILCYIHTYLGLLYCITKIIRYDVNLVSYVVNKNNIPTLIY